MEPAKQSIIIIVLGVLMINIFYGSAFLLRKSGLMQENNADIAENSSVLASIVSAENEQQIMLSKVSCPSVLPGKKIVQYEVQLHDNPSTIAARFGITLDTVLSANNLKYGESIYPGDKLDILPVSGVKHIIKKGETLESIAKKYHADADAIAKFNNLDAPDIGRLIIVPNGKTKIAKQIVVVRKKKISKYFINPTAGTITQRLHDHNAIDIGNKCGTPIYAAASGRIVRQKWGVRAGRYVIIEHANGTKTLYAHLSKFLTKLGQYVKQGQRIGLMGTSGRSTGCHLHFDVYGARNPLARYKLGAIIK